MNDELFILSRELGALHEHLSRDLERRGLRPSAIKDFIGSLENIWRREYSLNTFDYLGVELWEQNRLILEAVYVPPLMKLLEDRAYEEMGKLFPNKPSVEGENIEKFLNMRCKKACENRELPLHQTVKREIKHEIAKEIGMNVPDIKLFRPGNKIYHNISTVLSSLGYSEERPLI